MARVKRPASAPTRSRLGAAAGQASANGRQRSRLRAAIGVGAIVAAGLVYFGGVQARRYISAARLPGLPDLAGQPSAVRAHLTDRREAARRAPTSPAEVGALCLALHADLFYEQADRCYALVASLGAPDWRWTYYRALIQSERGGGGAFGASLREVLASVPDFGPAWLRLGDAEFKEGRYDKAEEAWTRAAAAAEPGRGGDMPEHAADAPVAVYASLGLARIALGRDHPNRAQEILERITAQAPFFGPAFRLLADTYTALGRPADAERAIRRANRLQPYAPYADPMVDALVRDTRNSTFLLRQSSEAGLGANAPWSEYLARRAVEFDPENPDAVSKLARMLRTLGRSDEALVLFEQYTRMVPDDFQGIGAIGSCLSDLGRFEEAEPFLRRALEGLDDALTHYNLGALLSRTGRLDEAVVEYQRALDRDPGDYDARSNMAAVLVRQGKLARAAQELERVLRLDPENANAHTNFGLLLAEQGQMTRAVQEFQTALRINPRQQQAQEALRSLGR